MDKSKVREVLPGTGISWKTGGTKHGSWKENDRHGEVPTRHLSIRLNLRCELELRHEIENIARQENVSLAKVCHMILRLGLMAYRRMQAHPLDKQITIELEKREDAAS